MTIRRLWLSLAGALLAASLLILLPNFADARAGSGGSFGSRGMRTYSMPPPSATAPGSVPARFVAVAAHPLLVAFEAIARFAAGLPFAAIAVSVSPLAVLLSFVAAVAVVVACTSRFPARSMAVAGGAACLTIWLA